VIETKGIRWAVRGMQGIGNKCMHVFVGKPEGKRPLGRTRNRWKGIKMYLKEIA
jgi:hypothetical protein